MITVLVRPGDRIRLPVGLNDVVGISHDEPTAPVLVYVDATDGSHRRMGTVAGRRRCGGRQHTDGRVVVPGLWSPVRVTRVSV